MNFPPTGFREQAKEPSDHSRNHRSITLKLVDFAYKALERLRERLRDRRELDMLTPVYKVSASDHATNKAVD